MNSETTIFRAQLVLLFLTIIILALAIMRMYIGQTFVTQGIDLGIMQRQIKNLDTQNMILAEKVYTFEAYTTIDKEAKVQGFIPATIIW